MTINLQVLESIHYITSMLIEIPQISENQHTMRTQVVSKHYRKLIESYDNRQAFVLAAEQNRDHIVFAARALNKSDWKGALDHIFQIGPLARMAEFECGELKTILQQEFKIAAMKSLLFRAAKQYRSFCVESLSNIFELDSKFVKKIISKMILENRLQASIDYGKGLVYLQEDGNDVKELQQLSL